MCLGLSKVGICAPVTLQSVLWGANIIFPDDVVDRGGHNDDHEDDSAHDVVDDYDGRS